MEMVGVWVVGVEVSGIGGGKQQKSAPSSVQERPTDSGSRHFSVEKPMDTETYAAQTRTQRA